MGLFMRMTMLLVIFGALLVSIGCEDNRTGVVIDTQKRRGFLQSGFESKVIVRRGDGSSTAIGHVGNPFYAIAFVEVGADNIGFVDPRIEGLAKRFELDSIAIIQMSIPKEAETFSQEAIAAGNYPPAEMQNLSRFIDPERRAWKIFGQPDCGAVLLVDRRGMNRTMKAKGSLDDLGPIITRLEWMQKEWEIERKGLRRD
ncbi:MAG: hypothetical protein HN350_10165 [Phycisphaerales bacterium]|jgi:hypothetical protein|nr:hypothetical protein [Phycisphaerales bacterium]